MKRLENFLFILFLGVLGSQLNAMEPKPIVDRPVEPIEDLAQDPYSEEYRGITLDNQANPLASPSASGSVVSSVPVLGRDNLPITGYADSSTASAIDVDSDNYVPTLSDLERGIVNADSVNPTFEDTMRRSQDHKAEMRQGFEDRGYDPSSPINPEVAQANKVFKDDWEEIRKLPRDQQQQARDDLIAKQKAERQKSNDERDAAYQRRLEQMRTENEESRGQARRKRVIQKSHGTISRSEEITERIRARKRATEEKQKAKEEEALRSSGIEPIRDLAKAVEENNLRVELERIKSLPRGDEKKETEQAFTVEIRKSKLDATTKQELRKLLFSSRKQDVSLRSTIVDKFTNEIERVKNLQLSPEELQTARMDLLKLLQQSSMSTEEEGTELRSQILSMGEPLETPVVESPTSVDEIMNEVERVKGLQLSPEELLAAKKDLLIKLGQSMSVGPERDKIRTQILSLEEPLQSPVEEIPQVAEEDNPLDAMSWDQVKAEYGSGSVEEEPGFTPSELGGLQESYGAPLPDWLTSGDNHDDESFALGIIAPDFENAPPEAVDAFMGEYVTNGIAEAKIILEKPNPSEREIHDAHVALSQGVTFFDSLPDSEHQQFLELVEKFDEQYAGSGTAYKKFDLKSLLDDDNQSSPAAAWHDVERLESIPLSEEDAQSRLITFDQRADDVEAKLAVREFPSRDDLFSMGKFVADYAPTREYMSEGQEKRFDEIVQKYDAGFGDNPEEEDDSDNDDDDDDDDDDRDVASRDNDVFSGHSDTEADGFPSSAGEEEDGHPSQISAASYSDMKEARQVKFKEVMDKDDEQDKKQFIVMNLESDVQNINNLLQNQNPSDAEIKYVALSLFQDSYFRSEMTAEQLEDYTAAAVEFGNKYGKSPLVESEFQEVQESAPFFWGYGSDTDEDREDSTIDVDDSSSGSETEDENFNHIQVKGKRIPQQRALTFFDKLISLPPASVGMGNMSTAYALNQGTVLNPQIAAQVNKITSMENLLAENAAGKTADSSMKSKENFYSTKIQNARQQQNPKEAVQLLADLEDTIVDRPIAPLKYLPEALQEDADVTSFIESSKTQRIALEKYFGIQSLFTQQAMNLQPLAVTALSTGQLSPQQTIQLTNALQTLTAQGNQLEKEQRQAKRDVATLKSLNTEIIQKLNTYINVLDQKEFDSQTQQKIVQIKEYQEEIASEQKRLEVYLEGLEGLSAHNREVTEFYFEVLDKMKREELSSKVLKEEILASPQLLQEEQREVKDASYDADDEPDEEDYPEALDEHKEEKECANNMKKVMSLEAQLSNILDQLHELQELLVTDSEKLRLTIRDAVETIIGKPSRYVEDAQYSVNSYSDMTNLITRGKDKTAKHEVLTVQQKEKIAIPFNKIGKSLAHLEKEIKSIQATIKELQKDHPQTSDKPVCQTLARMLNQLQKRLNGAKTVMSALREQDALDLDLIQMS